MFKNYLKIALRNIKKYKGYSIINIVGLAVGMACCLIIMLFVQDELGFDGFHEKADRLYRFNVNFVSAQGTFSNALSGAPMATHLLQDIPEVKQAVRFHQPFTDKMISYGDRRFYEKRFFYADAAVFEIFSFRLIKGDPHTALRDPFTVVLTESMASKYFGAEDPIGKSIRLENQQDYRVTGVRRDVPPNAHLHFDFLGSFSSLESQFGEQLQSWMFNPFITYVLLAENTSKTQVETKLPEFIDSYTAQMLEPHGLKLRPWLQAITEIHLYPQGNEIEAGSNMNYVYIFSAIAVMILLIACFNFMNLSTARATTRAKEVGLRKVIGADRKQLVRQFLGESIILAAIALVLALFLIELLLPRFNSIFERSLHLNYFENALMLTGIVTIAFLVGIISGSYPAFFLAAFKPVDTVKGKLETSMVKRTPLRFRQVLVIFQFAISIVLIVGTVVVYQQLHYMKTKDLGLNDEQVVVIPLRDVNLIQKQEAIKTQLLAEPGVVSVTYSNRPPGTGAMGTGVGREGAPREQQVSMKFLYVERDFVPALEIEMAAGRNFSIDFPSDLSEAFILNEKAVQDLGWNSPEEAIGERIAWAGRKSGAIIGVVKNFHFQPLQVFMQPLVLHLDPQNMQTLMVRIDGQDIQATMANLRRKWSELAPDWPFVYSFLDQDFDNLYKSQEQFGQMFGNFTFLAILIACLGLLGLAAFSAERRTKEIGIRKVLGASSSGIALQLSKEFTVLVGIAMLIAWPPAWYFMDRWLQSFSFRIDVELWTLALAGGLALLIAIVTVSTQAIRAALANPVESLRYE